MVCSVFSKDGSLFATSGSEGKVSVLSTISKTLVCELASDSSNRRTNEVSSISFSASGSQLAAGFPNGSVVVFDVAKSSQIASFSMTASSSSKAKVVSVAFDSLGRLVAGAGKGPVVCYDIANQSEVYRLEDQKCSCVCAVDIAAPSTKKKSREKLLPGLLVASSSIHVYNTVSGTFTAKKSGHANAIKRLAVWNRSAVSCASEDRSVQVWSLDEDLDTPVSVISFPSVPVELSVHEPSGLLSVVLEDGSVAFADLNKKGSQTASLVLKGAGARAVCSTSATDVLVAYGESIRPLFVKIDPSSKGNVGVLQFSDFVGKPLQQHKSEESSVKADTKVGRSGESQPSHGEVQVVPAPSSKRSKLSEMRAKELASCNAVDRASLTLEEQLRALSTMDQRKEGSARSSSIPTASSLSAALMQALQSGDAALFDQVVASARSDSKTITASIRRIPVTMVPLLLQQIVARFSDKPTRARMLVPWLRSTLSLYASFLSSSTSSSLELSRLLCVVEQRMKNCPRMVRLSGRLDLILSQSHQAAPEEEEEALEVSLDATSLQKDVVREIVNQRTYNEDAEDEDMSGDEDEEDEDEDAEENDDDDDVDSGDEDEEDADSSDASSDEEDDD
eukprot:ANDGO_06058.mRNA.1 U3 small nucleolar RNA-associated protein 5